MKHVLHYNWCFLQICPPEDERMASDEIFESTRRTNEETIRRLRQENKRLRRQLAEETAVSLHEKTFRSLMYLQSGNKIIPDLLHYHSIAPLVLSLRLMKRSSERPFMTEAWKRKPSATCQSRWLFFTFTQALVCSFLYIVYHLIVLLDCRFLFSHSLHLCYC